MTENFDVMKRFAGYAILAGVVITIIFIQLNAISNNRNDECAVCEWNWYAEKLYNYHDPGYGLSGPLKEIWREANYGKHYDLKWYEKLRIKYNLTDVFSFNLINYSNPCPSEPSLIYLGTGSIINYTPWSYDGPAYPLYIINYNGTNHSFSNCANNPYPLNMSNPVHIFRPKWGTWYNMFKEASLFDVTVYPDKPQEINRSWVAYRFSYSLYLSYGGVDIGTEY